MILNSIELENIRSYSKEKIEFPKGITLFEGDIGSGKSSVLMAIEFALFGFGSQKPEALLSKKASQGSVILNFEVDGKKYEIKRKLKRKENSVLQVAKDSYLLSDGQIEPLSPTELKQRVLQILNFNEPGDPHSESRIFRYAVFTPQEEMKQILRDSSRRLETVRKAFGVEDYKTASENARILSSALKTQIAVFGERFSKLNEDEEELKQLQKTVKNFEDVLANLEAQRDKIQNQIQDLEKERSELHKKEKLKIEVKSKLENIESEINSSHSLLVSFDEQVKEKLDEIEDIKSRLAELKKIKKPTCKTLQEIEKEISALSKIRDKVIKLEAKKDHIDSDIEKLQNVLGPISKFTEKYCNEKIQKHQHELDKDNAELEKLEKAIEKQKEIKIKSNSEAIQLKENLAKVAKFGSKCPYCNHKLTKTHIKKLEKERKENLAKAEKSLKDSEDKLAGLASEMEKIKVRIYDNEEKIDEIKRYLPDIRDLHEKSEELVSLEKELQVAQAQILISEEKSFPKSGFDDAVQYLSSLKDALVEYKNASRQGEELQRRQKNAELAVLKNNNQKKEVEEKISTLQKDYDTLQTELKSFAKLDGKILDIECELNEKNEMLSSTRDLISENKTNQKNSKDQILKLEEQIGQAKRWQDKHFMFSNYYDWFKEFFIPTVEQIEKQVLLSIQQNFNDIYRRWYSILIDDPTKESRIDEEFTPIIEQDGYEQDVDYLSGGEKTSIALAYRLTLNSLMRQETDSLKSNLLILDEPTDGFSKTQLSKVRSLLEELKSQQIILVSHEKELETYVDNIFQISKEDGLSKISILNS